ncbi:MAG: YfiR family protein [Cyclobacteriaceae bacterium]
MKQAKQLRWGFVVASLLFFSQSYAQISTRKLEAIYLYNFTKYINFPTTSGYTIGVLQDQEITSELQENLESKGGIDVKTINTVGEAENCHIVYVPKTKSSQLTALVSKLNKAGVLIVTEEDLANQGAPVSFVIDGSKLRFKINKLALEQSGLQASSSLLSLAILVEA